MAKKQIKEKDTNKKLKTDSKSSKKRKRNVKDQPPRKRPRRATKLTATWFDCCIHVVEMFLDTPKFEIFHNEVDITSFEDYYECIDAPMSLSTCKEKLKKSKYDRIDDFINDFELIWINCRMYNPPIAENQGILDISRCLETEFQDKMKKIVNKYGNERCQKKKNGRIP